MRFVVAASLTVLTVPDSVTSIGKQAFASCSKLTAIYFQGNAPSIQDITTFYNAPTTVYYLPGTSGWGATYGDAPTVQWIGSAATLYVWQDSPNPTPPYATWATAAKNIQDAVDVAFIHGTVLVTNGVYAASGSGGNRVEIEKAITVKSVNGPDATVIDGFHSVRCASLANNAVMSGFTLTNGRRHRAMAVARCATIPPS